MTGRPIVACIAFSVAMLMTPFGYGDVGRYFGEFDYGSVGINVNGGFSFRFPVHWEADFTVDDAQSMSIHQFNFIAAEQNVQFRDGFDDVVMDIEIRGGIEPIVLDLNPIDSPHLWRSAGFRRTTPMEVSGRYRSLNTTFDFSGKSFESRGDYSFFLNYEDFPHGMSLNIDAIDTSTSLIELEPGLPITSLHLQAVAFTERHFFDLTRFPPEQKLIAEQPAKLFDFDKDGIVGFEDFRVFDNIEQQRNATVSVPEPPAATAMLFVLCLGFAMHQRKVPFARYLA